jgi:hypothetical protein
MPQPKEEILFLAKISKQIDRYEEMTELMKKYVVSSVVINFYNKKVLTHEERNLLNDAYKYTVGTGRNAWKIVSEVESLEDPDSWHI